MAARNPRSSNTGAPSPITKLLPIIVIVVVALLGVGLYLFLPHGGNNPAPVATPDAATTTTAAQPNATAPAAPAPELTKEQLIKEASTAFREQRYVAPAGNNALEYYLRVLDKEPNNATAKDALREMFPFATPVVEQDINAGSVDEASRVIDLLAKADPNNYTLNILRGKLDIRKKQAEREQQQQAAATAAAAAKTAAAGAAQTAAAAAAANPTPDTAAATPAPAAATPASRPPTPAAATPTPPPPAAVAEATPAPAPSGESHPAQVVKTAQPDYPADAYRKRQEGWVEVEFTVTADGQVTNATVANANPARVFNEAALRAVQRWTFKPKMENGKAVEDRIKRRIEFKLGG